MDYFYSVPPPFMYEPNTNADESGDYGSDTSSLYE